MDATKSPPQTGNGAHPAAAKPLPTANAVDRTESDATILSRLSGEQSTTWKAVLQYKRALMWASFVALSAIMWGYDVLIGTGLLSSQRFRQDFGYSYKGQWVLHAKWQIAFTTSTSITGLMGCLATGLLSDRFGRRLTLGAACIWSCAAIFPQVFANHNSILVLGKLLNGLSLGSFLTIASSYAAEVSPIQLRGISTSGVSFFVGIGQLTANGLIKAYGGRDTSAAYRAPFAFQWILPVFVLILLPFCPESPVWLARQGRPDDTGRSLLKLGYDDVDSIRNQIQATIKEEGNIHGKSPSYLDCFRGTDLRRTEIAMGVTTALQLTGIIFVVGYCTYFFELAGLSDDNSFSLGLGVLGLGIVGNILSWTLINTAGRRASLLWGMVGLLVLLLLVGILEIIGGRVAVWLQVVCVILFSFIYFLAVGPMGWALYAEIASDRLRSRTVGLGIVSQNLCNIVLPVVVPYLLNPDELNLKGKLTFVFAVTTALCIVWIWLRVPETKGRVTAELDEMFAARIPARHFKNYYGGAGRVKVQPTAHFTGLTEPTH